MCWPWRKKPKPQPTINWHVPEGRDDLIPRRATDGSMAYDLISPETVVVPGHHYLSGVGNTLINTLVVVSLPSGYGIVLRSRSGLASKRGITVEAGEIDSDYRGLLKVLLFNHSIFAYKVKAGDRIAQARIVKIHELQDGVSYRYPDPDETTRGAGGFGSTGK